MHVFHVLDTAKRYGEIAEEKFQGWDIPGRYLVFGDPKDLKDLMARELAEATPVTLEEPAPKKYRDEYIIPGSGFRLLVGDIHMSIPASRASGRCSSPVPITSPHARKSVRIGVENGLKNRLWRLFRESPL